MKFLPGILKYSYRKWWVIKILAHRALRRFPGHTRERLGALNKGKARSNVPVTIVNRTWYIVKNGVPSTCTNFKSTFSCT